MELLEKVNKYYTEKVQTFGATAKGVDWNGKESHDIRFAQLCKLFVNESETFSVLDYGCGYGALFEFLSERNISSEYTGYDISEEMVRKAREKFDEKAIFTSTLDENAGGYDFAVACGVFNVKLEAEKEEWKRYVLTEVEKLNRLSRKGFSFNMLTSYSDAEFMRDYLYYADPLLFFDFCKRRFSRNIALLHDYTLYEFTIIVRK